MKSIETRAIRASNEMVDLLRSELLSQQYKDVVSRIFFAKFLLTNKQHVFQLPQHISWLSISSSIHGIGYQFDELFHEITRQNELFPNMIINFSLSHISDQVLYNCLMIIDRASLTEAEFQDFSLTGRYFKLLVENLMAKDKKELATFITPEGLNKLMVNMLKPAQGEVYDGAVGIGGSLIEAYKFSNGLILYGQEIHESNVSLAYMNAIVHGIDLFKFKIEVGDTLFDPRFINGSELKQFDYIMMNPPFGFKLGNMEFLDYDPYGRFSGRMGKTGRSHGDLAFLQHAVASLNERGKAALIIPVGVLSRSSYAEKAFREFIVQTDIIDTIVLLPYKILPSVSIQTVLLVLNKNKSESRKNKIQFINAEEQYGISGRSQYYLRQEDIESIVSKYEKFISDTEDSRVVDYQEIRGSEYILSPKHYFTSQIVESEFGEVVINKALYEEKVKNKISLKKIAELSRGVNLPSKSLVKEGGNSHKVIQLKDVDEGYIYIDNIDIISVQNPERYMVKQGDIIIASRGTAFKVAIVPEHEENLVLSNMFIRIRIFDKTSYMPEYIKTFIESPIGVALIEGMQKGGTVRALTTSDIENIEFPNVTIEEQKEIVQTVIAAEHKYKELLQQAQDILKQGKFSAYSKMGISGIIEGID